MIENTNSTITVTTLGTSHGDQTYCRFNSSTLFEINNNAYIIDAGAPVEALFIRAGKKFKNLKAVFITHMHNDHIGGIAGLIKALVKYPVGEQYAKIYLPEKSGINGLSEWLKAQHLPCPSPLYSLHKTTEGLIYQDNILNVSAIGTYHLKTNLERFSSYAYILEAYNKRITYTGDLSADFSDFPEIIRNEKCDLCICESTHFDMDSAINILKHCPIKKLIFNHVADKWHGDGEKRLMNMLNNMPFPCCIAHDGDVFTV